MLSHAPGTPEQKVRVLFLLRSLDYGGAERQLVTLAGGLDRRRFEAGVVCFYPGGALEAELHNLNIPVLALRKRGRWDVLNFWRQLNRTVDELNPDLLQAYLPVPNLLAGLLKLRRRKPAVAFGLRGSQRDLSVYDWLYRLTHRLERAVSGQADLLIVNSQAGRAHFEALGYPAARMAVVPNGIDTHRFQHSPAGRQQVRAGWGIAAGQMLVGIVGRLDPVKDHATFLQAAALVAEDCPQARFVIIGAGPAEVRARLQAQAAAMGLAERTRWEEGRSDMPAVYSALDVLVLSSRSEGFPNVVAEAMACETACAVTAAGDAAEIVGTQEQVAPPGQPAALAQACLRLLALSDMERQTLGRLGRARIEDRFSVERMVSRTQELYLDVVQAQRERAA